MKSFFNNTSISHSGSSGYMVYILPPDLQRYCDKEKLKGTDFDQVITDCFDNFDICDCSIQRNNKWKPTLFKLSAKTRNLISNAAAYFDLSPDVVLTCLLRKNVLGAKY